MLLKVVETYLLDEFKASESDFCVVSTREIGDFVMAHGSEGGEIQPSVLALMEKYPKASLVCCYPARVAANHRQLRGRLIFESVDAPIYYKVGEDTIVLTY